MFSSSKMQTGVSTKVSIWKEINIDKIISIPYYWNTTFNTHFPGDAIQQGLVPKPFLSLTDKKMYCISDL